MKSKSLVKNEHSNLLIISKAIIFSITISLILLLLFALVIRFVDVSEKIVLPVNQVIKILSLFFGCLFSLRKTNKGFIKGILVGIFYAILTYIVFSILSKTFMLKLTTITDILFCGIIGGLCGIICVNLRKN